MSASRKSARDLKVMMSIMLRTTDIMRASLNLMVLASLQIVDQEWRDFCYEGSLQTVELLMQYPNELDLDYVFMNLAPYNDWVNFSTPIFRCVHLMETKLCATNNYAYLMSSYILVCQTKTLLSDTLSLGGWDSRQFPTPQCILDIHYHLSRPFNLHLYHFRVH